MKRFLPLLLFAGLLSPITAKADDFKVRDTCGQFKAGFIDEKVAHKRLGLPKNRIEDYPERRFDKLDRWEQTKVIDRNCGAYLGTNDSYYGLP